MVKASNCDRVTMQQRQLGETGPHEEGPLGGGGQFSPFIRTTFSVEKCSGRSTPRRKQFPREEWLGVYVL